MQMWLENYGIKTIHSIRNRDTKFTESLDMLMQQASLKIVKTPVQSQNVNAYAGGMGRKCF